MGISCSKRRTPPIIMNVHHNQVPPHINHLPPRNNLVIVPNQNQPRVPPHINHPPPRNNLVIFPNQNQPRLPRNPVIVVNQNKPFKLRDAILQARNMKNLSQVRLAQKIYANPQKIQEYESGWALPSQVTISKLQKVLGVNLQDLYKTELRGLIMQARQNLFMTQTELAKKLRVTVQIIKNYEYGKTIPKENMMCQLEKALGLRLH